MDAVHLFIIVLFALQLVEGVAQRVPALLIQDPSILLVDEVVVKLHQVLDPRTVRELLLGCTPELEEVCAEPNLLYVSLVAALRYYLLYRVLLVALLVLSQPHQRKTSPSQQLNLLEALGEAVAECLHLFTTQVKRVLFLFLPLYLDPFEGLLAIFLSSAEALGCCLFGSIFVVGLMLFPGEDFDGFDRFVFEGLLLESVLDVTLLAVRVSLLLACQVQVLQTLGHILLQGSLLEPRTMRLVSLPETVVLAAVGGLYFFEG